MHAKNLPFHTALSPRVNIAFCIIFNCRGRTHQITLSRIHNTISHILFFSKPPHKTLHFELERARAHIAQRDHFARAVINGTYQKHVTFAFTNHISTRKKRKKKPIIVMLYRATAFCECRVSFAVCSTFETPRELDIYYIYIYIKSKRDALSMRRSIHRARARKRGRRDHHRRGGQTMDDRVHHASCDTARANDRASQGYGCVCVCVATAETFAAHLAAAGSGQEWVKGKFVRHDAAAFVLCDEIVGCYKVYVLACVNAASQSRLLTCVLCGAI